ncbi:MAG: hydroxyethylthiazole kinase [Catonella sp.]
MKNIRPLVHIISNEVTLNNVVNVILGAGGRAICATAVEEILEITSNSKALILNTGMPSKEKLKAMLIAGRRANEIGIPVVLDPVGVGASAFRRNIVNELLENISFTCIKGNKSEIAELCGVQSASVGVDSNITEINHKVLKLLSDRTGAIIAATGEVNVIADPNTITEIPGGSKLLRRITGSGCMLTGIIGVYLAEENNYKETVVSAFRYFNAAAKQAEVDMMAKEQKGTGTYLINLLDRLSERDR